MSADIVACPQCGTNLQNSPQIAGRVVACPQCRIQLQMPPMSQPVAAAQLPAPVQLPPTIDASLPARTDVLGSRSPLPGPLVQPKRPKPDAAPSAADRLRKRSNPWLIVFALVMVVVVTVVGVSAYLSSQAEAARKEFARQLVGNWELVPGQSQLERWDFAFHNDGQLQMALGSQLNDGRWKVTSVRGATGYVLIEWPDDAPETMRVRLERGALQISLDSVGDFAFRAAAP